MTREELIKQKETLEKQLEEINSELSKPDPQTAPDIKGKYIKYESLGVEYYAYVTDVSYSNSIHQYYIKGIIITKIVQLIRICYNISNMGDYILLEKVTVISKKEFDKVFNTSVEYLKSKLK